LVNLCGRIASIQHGPIPPAHYQVLDAVLSSQPRLRFVDLISSLWTPAFSLARRHPKAACVCNDVSGSIYRAITQMSEAFVRQSLLSYGLSRLSDDIEVEIVAGMLGVTIDRIDAVCAASLYAGTGTMMLLWIPPMPADILRSARQHLLSCIAIVHHSRGPGFLLVPSFYAYMADGFSKPTVIDSDMILFCNRPDVYPS
jgi:hypothetical protein